MTKTKKKPVSVVVEEELLQRIDSARNGESRNAWIVAALDDYLTNHQPHSHLPGTLLRIERSPTSMVRVYACRDCGAETTLNG